MFDMTYEDFENKVKALGLYGTGSYRQGDYALSEAQKKARPAVLEVKWETGGVSGGSCWDDSDPQPYSRDDPPPDFEDLDKVLEAVAPQITHLQYKRLCRKCVVTGSYTEHEYYGNQTDYSYKRVELRELYNTLCEIFDS